ncbi:MAG: hypothetical protein PHS92_00865 [Candidatus Gracilibacteria bacterium]|nr:hypothetical protein [Candidatus Gracilibacteria bacterium]
MEKLKVFDNNTFNKHLGDMAKYLMDILPTVYGIKNKKEVEEMISSASESYKIKLLESTFKKLKEKRKTEIKIQENKLIANKAEEFLNGNETLSNQKRIQKILDSFIPKDQRISIGGSFRFEYFGERGQKVNCSLIFYKNGAIVTIGGFPPQLLRFGINLSDDSWLQIGSEGIKLGPISMYHRGLAAMAGYGKYISYGNFNMQVKNSKQPDLAIFDTIIKKIDSEMDYLCFNTLKLNLKLLKENYTFDYSANKVKECLININKNPPNPQTSLAWIKKQDPKAV